MAGYLIPTKELMFTVRSSVVSLMLLGTIILSHLANGGHDGQRQLQLGFIGVAICCMVAGNRVPSFQALLGKPAARLLALFFSLGMVSSLVSQSPLNGFREVLLLALLLPIALCIAHELRGDYGRRLDLALLVFAGGCALYTFKVGVVWLTALLTHTPYDPYAFSPGFSNYRFFNHAQTVGLPLLVLAVCRSDPEHRKLWLCVAAFWACLLMVFGARGSALGLFAGTVAMIALQRSRSFLFCKNLVAAAVAGAILLLILFVWIPRAAGLPAFGDINVIKRSAGEPLSFRDILWERALDFIADHPWLGIGPAHYGKFAADLDISAHPHNWILQIGAEWGVAALLCLLAVLWLAIRAVLKVSRNLDREDAPNQTILSALIVTGVAILVDGLVSGLIVMPVSQLMIVLYIGCAAGWVWSLKPPHVIAIGKPRRIAVGAGMLGATVALVLSAAHDARGVPAGDLATGAFRLYPDRSQARPRFWLDEYFTKAELVEVLACAPRKVPPCR